MYLFLSFNYEHVSHLFLVFLLSTLNMPNRFVFLWLESRLKAWYVLKVSKIIQCFHLYSNVFLFHTKLTKSRETIVKWLGTKTWSRTENWAWALFLEYLVLTSDFSKARKSSPKVENSMVLSDFLYGYTSASLYSRYSLCFTFYQFFFIFWKKLGVAQKNYYVCTKIYVVSTKKYFT